MDEKRSDQLDALIEQRRKQLDALMEKHGNVSATAAKTASVTAMRITLEACPAAPVG